MKRIIGVFLLFFATFASSFAAETPKDSKTLAIYGLVSSYMNWKEIAGAYAKKTGIQPTLDLKGGSSISLAALEVEREKPVGNGAFYATIIAIEANNKGLHQFYKPAGYEKIPNELKDPEGYWWSISTSNITINANTEILKKKGLEVPGSWADLIHPRYKNMVTIVHPAQGGTAYCFVFSINMILGGNETDFRPAFRYLKTLKNNGTRFVRENMVQGLVTGEYPITIDAEGNGLLAKYVRNGPVSVVIPEEGVASVALGMGLAKGAPEAAATKKFFDWLLTDEAQGLVARAYFRPVVKGMIPADIAGKFPDIGGKLVTYDQVYAAKIAPSLKEAFNEIIDQGAEIDETLRRKNLLQ